MQDRPRIREAVNLQQRRPARPEGRTQPPLEQGGGEPPRESPPPRGMRRVLYGVLAALAAVGIGAAVLNSQTSGVAPGQFQFSVIADPQQVVDYIHQQHLPPAKEQRLEEQAKKQELVVWHVTQSSGWTGQEGEAFTMDNGVDRYQFTIRSEGQEFGVFADKSTTGFNFSADADPPGVKMTGTWYTPAGRTPYNMQVGQTMVVKVH